MKSVAFFNNKGGVGKTTLLCNVAAYAALEMGKKVCVVDADPQCNATQYFFNEQELDEIYDESNFTIESIFRSISDGEGFSTGIDVRPSKSFGLDVLPGDPRLALSEDLLAADWGVAKGGNIRGIRTNLVFSDLLKRLEHYDYVFFDVSPSLGAINRAILLSTDVFMSPMSIDIFSLKAFENISKWISGWDKEWNIGLQNVQDKTKIPNLKHGRAKFLGYVTQQYLAKKDASGNPRGVQAYDRIMSQIDGIIEAQGLGAKLEDGKFAIGTVPNLFSLIPMSQSRNKPVFKLESKDGVVGAHFAKVKDSLETYGAVAEELLRRVDG